ncbi:hypothetical protein JUNP499_1543 [Acinetobacter baumannii]
MYLSFKRIKETNENKINVIKENMILMQIFSKENFIINNLNIVAITFSRFPLKDILFILIK